MELQLDDQEAQVLINLIDIAVKSQGLAAAEAGLHFVNTIKMAKAEANRSIRPALEKTEADECLDTPLAERPCLETMYQQGRRANRDQPLETTGE